MINTIKDFYYDLWSNIVYFWKNQNSRKFPKFIEIRGKYNKEYNLRV